MKDKNLSWIISIITLVSFATATASWFVRDYYQAIIQHKETELLLSNSRWESISSKIKIESSFDITNCVINNNSKNIPKENFQIDETIFARKDIGNNFKYKKTTLKDFFHSVNGNNLYREGEMKSCIFKYYDHTEAHLWIIENFYFSENTDSNKKDHRYYPHIMIVKENEKRVQGRLMEGFVCSLESFNSDLDISKTSAPAKLNPEITNSIYNKRDNLDTIGFLFLLNQSACIVSSLFDSNYRYDSILLQRQFGSLMSQGSHSFEGGGEVVKDGLNILLKSFQVNEQIIYVKVGINIYCIYISVPYRNIKESQKYDSSINQWLLDLRLIQKN